MVLARVHSQLRAWGNRETHNCLFVHHARLVQSPLDISVANDCCLLDRIMLKTELSISP
jgi:hypothetical protein